MALTKMATGHLAATGRLVTRDSREGRVLLALRGGPHERHEIEARFGVNVQAPLASLSKRGLIEVGDGTWSITAAGRAACPFRNPLLAAEAASQPEKPKENIMANLQGTTYKNVVAAIIAAGPAGLTRKQLAEQFACGTRSDITRIDAHVCYALKQEPPAIARLTPGHYVAVDYMPVKPDDEAPTKTVGKVERQAPLEKFPAPVFADIPVPVAPQPGLFGRLRIDDPGLLEFAVFSTGNFELHTEFGVISLSQAAMRKLRAFLGLFVSGEDGRYPPGAEAA